MIRGLGIDGVEVARIEAALEREGFAERILTPAERGLGLSPPRVAGRWAAKEAVAKAVGLHLGWQDVEILNDDEGRPVASVAGLPEGTRVLVSITHERGLAVAVAVYES